MKKAINISLIFIFFSLLISCNSGNTSGIIGKELFTELKNLFNSNENKLSEYFIKKEDGIKLYRELIEKSPKFGMNNWNNIEYINYIHKEISRDGTNYSSGFLAIRLNNNSEYKLFGLWLLNIKVENKYKVLYYNDEWSIDSEIQLDWERMRSNLDEILEQWI